MKKPDLTKYKTTSSLYLLILIIAAVALVFGWQCTSYSLSNHSADLHIQMLPSRRVKGSKATTVYRISDVRWTKKASTLMFYSQHQTVVVEVDGIKRPEVAFKCFIRFVLAQAAVTYGMELMNALFRIAQGAVSTIMDASGMTAMSPTTLPEELITAIESVGLLESIPLWAVTLLGSLFIWVLSLVMILTVYSRFFKLYMATAIAPIPLASFAGQPSSSIGVAFLKSYAAICLEGCIIVLACVIFSQFASAPPAVGDASTAPATLVWNYIGELIFNMLVLVGSIKMSDRIIRELMGLG